MKRIPLIAAALSLASTPSFAAHPLITDDTGTQGKGKFQIEWNNEFAWNNTDDGGVITEETAGESAVAISYGLTEHIDLVAAMPFQWYSIEENGVQVGDDSGIGDMSIELKWRVLEQEDEGFSLAVKPGISIPSGDEKQGFGSGAVSPGIMLIATKEGDFGALHCNAGYSRNNYRDDTADEATRDDIWHASVAAEINLSDNLRAVANIGMETSEEQSNDSHPAFLIGGMIWGMSDNLDLDLGVKCGLNDAETDTALLAGLAARF